MKRFFITESDKKYILKKYGLLIEQEETNTEMSSITQKNEYGSVKEYNDAKKKYDLDLVDYNSLVKDYNQKIERYKDQMAVYDLIEKVGTGKVSLYDTSRGFAMEDFSSVNNFDIARLTKIINENKLSLSTGDCPNDSLPYLVVLALLSNFFTSFSNGTYTKIIVKDGIVSKSNPRNFNRLPNVQYDSTFQDRIGLISDGTNYEFDGYWFEFFNGCNNYDNFNEINFKAKLMKFKTPIPPSEPIKPIKPILNKDIRRVQTDCGLTLVGKWSKSGFDYIEDTKTGEKLGDYDKSKSTDWNIRKFCKQ